MSPNRQPTAFVLGLLAFCLLTGGHAAAIDVGEHVTTADPLAGGQCSTPAAKTAFSPDDATAWLWLEILDAAEGDAVEWRFFAPGNVPYATTPYEVTFDGDGCAWGGINIKGQSPASTPGQWRVDVYLNDTLAASASFTISPQSVPPANAGAAHLDFSVNDQILVPWSYRELRYRLRSFTPGLRVDLYLALLLGGTGDQCTAPELVFTTAVPPFATDLALADTDGVVFAGDLPGSVDPVTMTLYGVLVPTGASPGDPGNWVSNLAAMDLALATLSSRQTEVIIEQGNPEAFIIDFDRARQRRVETSIYQQGALGSTFEFINGATVGTVDDGARAAGPPGRATRYDPGRFSPATTPEEIRALLGDPDHVLTGSVAGRVVWIFDDAGLTVTLEGGAIRRIKVY